MSKRDSTFASGRNNRQSEGFEATHGVPIADSVEHGSLCIPLDQQHTCCEQRDREAIRDDAIELTTNLIGIYRSIEFRLHLVDRGEMDSDHGRLIRR